MEKRFRYTHIRDDLELPHLASKLRRKCGNCLRKMKGDSEDEAKNGNATQTETQMEVNNTSQMVETGNNAENRDGTQIEAQTETNNITETVASGEDMVTETETRTEYDRMSQTIASGEGTDSRDVTGTKAQGMSQTIASSEDTDTETEVQEELNDASQMIDSERPEQGTSESQEEKKEPKKKKKCKNLQVLKRCWFKRDQSPPPKDEMEEHLNDIRMRTRKEIHTLLYLNSAVQEKKIKLMRKYAAMLDEKSQKKWNKFIDMIDTEYAGIMNQPTEYNANNLLERLRENPELMEAVDKIKPDKITLTTIMEESFEIATRIERQFFSLIPGVPGLTAYKNAMICEIARDESVTITV
ncbi:hypothetical protein WUBG_09379 [Wuchereria bancrofti]|nr:hypothetical protein WUBG_09379 [Wuchereria bancrofti]